MDNWLLLTCLVVVFGKAKDTSGLALVVLLIVLVDRLLRLLFSGLIFDILLPFWVIVLLLLVCDFALFLLHLNDLLLLLDIRLLVDDSLLFIINFGAHLRGSRSGLTFLRAQT